MQNPSHRRTALTPKVLAERQRIATRNTRAYEMRLAGHTWDAIARELGFADRGRACHAVRGLIENVEGISATTREELRAVDLARTLALLAAHWVAALNRDRDSSKIVLECLRHRADLLGLNKVTVDLTVTDAASIDALIDAELAGFIAALPAGPTQQEEA